MTPGQQMFATVFVAIVGSGLINLLIQHHWEKHSELGKLTKAVQDMNEKVDQNAAVLSREHILRFDDELINGVEHTKEYFRQELEDIDTYENYCKTHPKFKNSYTTEAAAHIRNTYEMLRDRGEFCRTKKGSKND